jgi:ribose-phosphate pyrophosphokinase
MQRIIASSSSSRFAKNLSAATGIPVAKVDIERFPDGECHVCVTEDVKNALVIGNTYPDESIIELCLLQDAVRRGGSEKVSVVIPYFGYGRQDKVFERGEAVSAEKIARLIELDADKVITVDPHKEYITEFFNIPTCVCSAVEAIAQYFTNKVDTVLAPDKGAVERASRAAHIIGCPFDYLEKKRLSGNKVEMIAKDMHVAGMNVLVIDDIISTGGTMAEAVKSLKKQGADNVFIGCSHGLFIGNAVERIRQAGCDKIVSTDTVESQYSEISVANQVVECL